MANATVEKLKALGIRHGEKAVVGLGATLCVLFFGIALAKPTIDLTADQVKDDAKKAEQNLSREQNTDEIIAKLEADGLKNPSFEKTVDTQATVALDSKKFRLQNSFAYPEPGAGLICDQPKLIAPTDLVAHASRGGTPVYVLDEDGKRKIKTVKDDQKTKKRARKRGKTPNRSAYGGGYGSGYGGGRGGYGMAAAGSREGSAEQEAKRKKDREEKAKRLGYTLTGKAKDDAGKDKEKEDADALGPGQEYEETTKGLRWVALVAEIDYKQLRENYAAAMKRDFASAYPNFIRLDLERQTRDDDGAWTNWELIDREANEKILFNVAEQDDDELTPEDVRLEPLVDFLPFLRAGYWKGVHLRSLVPKEKQELPKEQEAGGMLAGMPYGGRSGGYGGYNMQEGYQDMMNKSGSRMGSAMGGYAGMYGGYGGEAGYGMGGLSAGTTENTNFPKSEAETIMGRALDFTVVPETVYRYRIRLVVFNPNKDHENVSPGVDNTSEELTGPWSEASNEVNMPADVTAYARHMSPGEKGGRSDKVQFQVARWNPEDGLTVYKTFDAGPGQILGSTRSTEIPILDETTTTKDDQPTKIKPIDYNTHQMVLDTKGGSLPLPRITGVSGANFEIPALALLLRPDGTVVIRDQVVDHNNDEMAEMKTIYDRALAEAKDKDKKTNTMGGYGGEGMPGSGGSGAGGPMGGRRGGRR